MPEHEIFTSGRQSNDIKKTQQAPKSARVRQTPSSEQLSAEEQLRKKVYDQDATKRIHDDEGL